MATWIPVEGVARITWDVPDTIVEGIWQGIVPGGRFGPVGQLDMDGTTRPVDLPVVLKRQALKVRVGALMQIHYLGLKPGKHGTSYKNFATFVRSRDDLLQDVTPSPVDLTDDTVPF